MHYWRIHRADGKVDFSQTFDELVRKSSREDLDNIWIHAQRKQQLSEMTAKEIQLYMELKNMYINTEKCVGWQLQKHIRSPVTWRLYYVVGVHKVVHQRCTYFMLVELD